MRDTMSRKERWLGAIRIRPVDRLPFWPKLNPAYMHAQVPEFRNMDLDSIHDWIGSDKHIGIAGCVKEVRRSTAIESVESDGVRRTLYRTPHGEMDLVSKYDEPSQSWHPVTFPVRTPDDVCLMTEIYADTQAILNEEGLEQARAQARAIGDDAIVVNTIGTSPLMHWIEWLAGMETANYLLADHPGEVEGLFDAMHRVLMRKTELFCEHSPADALYFSENTSTTLTSPQQYRQYCARHIGDYADVLRAADRNLILHMCGHLKALLPDLAVIPAQAFEAFTSPTLGNTTLLDGRTQCPNTCLIGGTNAMLWTRSAEEIISEIERDLDGLPHHRGIVITSAGVMPPMCKPETIRQVCGWVREYPARMD